MRLRVVAGFVLLAFLVMYVVASRLSDDNDGGPEPTATTSSTVEAVTPQTANPRDPRRQPEAPAEIEDAPAPAEGGEPLPQ